MKQNTTKSALSSSPLFMLMLVMLFNFPLVNAQESATTFIADSWLAIEPQAVIWPAFSKTPDINGDTVNYKQLLDQLPGAAYSQAKGGFPLDNQLTNAPLWQKLQATKSGFVIFNLPKKQQTAWTLISGYLETERFAEFEFELETSGLAVLFVDGEQQLAIENVTKKGETTTKSKKIKLTPGKHFFLIKSLYDKHFESDWKIKLGYTQKAEYTANWTISPEKRMNLELLLEGKRLQGVALHPSGNYMMIAYSETTKPDGDQSSWTEIVQLPEQQTIYSTRHSSRKQLKFHPKEAAFFYRLSEKDNSSLWLHSLDKGEDKLIVDNISDMGFYRIDPKGGGIFYSKQFKAEDEKTGLKKLEDIADRWPWWRSRSQLFYYDLERGQHRQLSSGKLSTQLHDISPVSDQILISQSEPDYSQRPYSKQYMMLLDLNQMTIDTLWISNYSANAKFSPDGKKILLTGGPLLFGDAGKDVPENVIPNDYDTQAYIYELQSKKLDAITTSFDPKILDAVWSQFDDMIYFRTEDQSYKRLVKYDPVGKTFTPLKTAVDVVNGFDLANDKALLIYDGSSISTPEKAFLKELDSQQESLVADPEAADFENVRFGQTNDWNFNTQEGDLIPGHVYYPPQFDPDKKYPLIVYYYGGTNPIDRSFRGRYPKNLFAAHGYVVYVIIPSGATGFGQEFSARHVNNWGITVADEIIEGTKHFYRSNAFIDSTAIGCIGASYGGFMTMLLATRTDLFSAAIAHAGISSISSYWGEGYWGYLYSATATANNFPWNNKELYTEQSPLFHADKVSTPLLLLHGGSDTNVPKGESIQLYTALKLLGKTVEYVEIEGQDHHIVDYKKRRLWQQSILAWYDFYLKNQPEWWNALYPEKNL
ncbi:MAG: prolyl oligopeptidase family serine peptidase [Bacteroidetes bacterium]|nr:prolyl oligopeptidase family serine peptidase [Bacteroidota bacterium]MBU1579473.1 prolyl oligopeptidase family serine peptidase [Bacteroidota bacterium]MBU2557961.1 prolyl oligopeptidase family serine peptidase [Bacteroidota bacterium]